MKGVDLLRLAPADRFLTAAAAHGLKWHRSRTGQFYGQCPAHEDSQGSAALGVGDDGSCGFTCFAGCRTADVLDALELSPWALFARGSRGPTVDLAARERMETADQRALDLQAHSSLVNVLASVEHIAPWALSELGVGLLVDKGLSFTERNHRGQATALTIVVPKSLRDRVEGPSKRVEPGGRRGVVYPVGGLIGNDVVVVEGAMTAVAATTLGHQCVALPSASWKFTASSAASFFRHRNVSLIPDGDRLGRTAMERTAESALSAGAESVGIVDLHRGRDDGRDLADDLREHGSEAASQMLATAIGRTTFTQPNRTRGRPPKSLSTAESYLQERLADGDWHRVADINSGAPSDVSERTLKRARERMNIESRKFGKSWNIRLPQSAT